MIRLLHIIPFMSVGGTEQMLLNMCKFRNQAEFEYIVFSSREGIITDEIRETGVPVYTGWENCYSIMDWAEIINLHLVNFDPSLHEIVRSSGKPYVATLHWVTEMPKMPALTICTSIHAYQIQEFKSRFVPIPNGVDLSRFYPRPKRPKDEVIITRVCRPDKCALYFWEAIKKVIDHYPQARLWIVGNESVPDKPLDRVHFWGIRRDIPEILAETDIFAYTPYPEAGTKDLVVMEASAMGVPCVVSDVNATQESVQDGENGFLVPFGDVEAFAKKIGIMIEDADLRARLGQNAVRIARENFDMQRVSRRYEVVYRAVLDAYQGNP